MCISLLMQMNPWINDVLVFLTHVDPCMVVFPPCMSEADRFSLEALRSIHQMMDDDQDGGIEVEESVEVHVSLSVKCLPDFLSCCKSMYMNVLARKRQIE